MLGLSGKIGIIVTHNVVEVIRLKQDFNYQVDPMGMNVKAVEMNLETAFKIRVQVNNPLKYLECIKNLKFSFVGLQYYP